MKRRTVVLQIEVETDLPLMLVRKASHVSVADGEIAIPVRQVQVNVITATKPERRPKSRKRKGGAGC